MLKLNNDSNEYLNVFRKQTVNTKGKIIDIRISWTSDQITPLYASVLYFPTNKICCAIKLKELSIVHERLNHSLKYEIPYSLIVVWHIIAILIATIYGRYILHIRFKRNAP